MKDGFLVWRVGDGADEWTIWSMEISGVISKLVEMFLEFFFSEWKFF